MPYKPYSTWSDKIVVSKTTGTSTDSSPFYTTDTLYVDYAYEETNDKTVTTAFYVELYVDGVKKDTKYQSSLSSGYYGSKTDFSIGKLSAGTHTIKMKVDSTNAVAETNESDNEYSRTITVISSKTLSSVSITSGLSSIAGGSYSDYKATAYFSDGTSADVTSSATWIENSSYAYFDTSVKGRLKTNSVTSNQSVTITASYTYNSVTKNGTKSVTITPVITKKPDLTVADWYAEWDDYGDGSFTYTVKNQGTAASYNTAWDINLVLSPDSIIGNGDEIFLFYEDANYSIDPGVSVYRDDWSPGYFNLYYDVWGDIVPSGIYYMAVWIDDGNDVDESNESNNYSLGTGTVYVDWYRSAKGSNQQSSSK